ncbi:MAG TPA: M3 family metallopeptidase, partial [Steroidobacteraceae bacterium]|nr:M3 family metallopeptidase [Steroidobacteraceae bacterium]
ASLPAFADFQAKAGRANLVLTLPDYPKTPEEIQLRALAVLGEADRALAALVAQDPASATFESTFVAFDRITSRVNTFSNQVGTLAETHPDKAMRDTAREAGVKLESWGIGLEYREDIYRALKACADAKPTLDAQQQRLLDFAMRDYRRAGLALPAAERQRVEQLRKNLSELTQQFDVGVNEARAPLDFTAEQLTGVPPSFLESPGVRQPDGTYRVMANITWHATAVANNADNSEVRRQVLIARNQLARETNIPVLAKIVALRAEIASRLGYANWADYRTETRMAGTGATALKFEEELVAGLQPKFTVEMETLRQLKAAHTGEAEASIEPWDVSYYTNKLSKERYAVDTEALRVFFPYQPTLEGMFAIYQRIFGLKFTQVEPPYTWAPGVQLWVVEDA